MRKVIFMGTTSVSIPYPASSGPKDSTLMHDNFISDPTIFLVCSQY